MFAALPLAFEAHRITGRVRLRVPSQRGNEDYFHRLARALPRCPGLKQHDVNPRTGSVLLWHDSALLDVYAFAEDEELFQLAPGGKSVASRLSSAIADAAGNVAGAVDSIRHGRFDLPAVLFIALFTAAVFQWRRGHVWPAATSLLWYAMSWTSNPDERGDDP